MIMSKLVFHRICHLCYGIRKFKLYANGKRIGYIKPGDESISFDLSPGHYKLQVKIDINKSNRLKIEILENEEISFIIRLKQFRKTELGRYFELMKIRNIELIRMKEGSAIKDYWIPLPQLPKTLHPSVKKELSFLEGGMGIVLLLFPIIYFHNDISNLPEGAFYMIFCGLFFTIDSILYFRKEKSILYFRSNLFFKGMSHIVILLVLLILNFDHSLFLLTILIFILVNLFLYLKFLGLKEKAYLIEN
jgi:hypothetical protein